MKLSYRHIRRKNYLLPYKLFIHCVTKKRKGKRTVLIYVFFFQSKAPSLMLVYKVKFKTEDINGITLVNSLLLQLINYAAVPEDTLKIL